MKKLDTIVFIGRFQPFHNGHLEVILSALTQAKKVLILVGSSNQPRTPKNPFTFDERRKMINEAVISEVAKTSDTPRPNFAVLSLRDQKYSDQMWVSDIQSIVNSFTGPDEKIGIIGHTKDDSSYYLKMFPQWELIEHGLNEQINATDIRQMMFDRRTPNYLNGVVPNTVRHMIGGFVLTTDFATLREEYDMINKYKKAWEAAPYAPTFVTTDAIVIQSGHVLLIKRKASPGKGLTALVGGFLNQDEWIIDGMIRELREETKIKVPTPVLKGSIKKSKVYDRPDRSSRGRTITHAFLIELPPGPLPYIKGSDDAEKAFWLPISEIKEIEMFEDHFAILQDMLGFV